MAVEKEAAIELGTIIMWLVSGGVTILLGILGYLAKNTMDSIKSAIDNMSIIVGELKDSVDKLKDFTSRQDEKNNKFNAFEKDFEAALDRVNTAISEKIKDLKVSFTEKFDKTEKIIDSIWVDMDNLNKVSNENSTKLRELEKIHEYCKNSRRIEK